MRSRQFEEIDAFRDAKAVPADERVLVAGDLNVDSRSSEYPRGTPAPSTPGTTRSPVAAIPATRARIWTTCSVARVTPVRRCGRTRSARRRVRPGRCRAGAPTTRTPTCPTTVR
ncbi:endonuclease/exonuclease/phosphatase family protein [Streptomyces sp.]|uniref:endonuclease/exonuclease/phosphatase family protein n=1 Tax=Streptomyces sp. TaxID=1931 RepID=UPI0035C7383B